MKKKSPFLYFFLFVSIILVGFLFWWNAGGQPVDALNKEKIYFVVNKGDGLSVISLRLKKENLIKDPFFFKVLSFILGTAQKMKTGGYYLSPSMEPKVITQTLTKGVDDQWVTIIEGLRAEEIGELLIKKGFAINPEEWVQNVKNSKLEGRLFPDSYLFPRGSNQETILKIIQKNYQKKAIDNLIQDWSKTKNPPELVLTLASLLEREAKTLEDREIVAGILLKRLENDWPLQIDATVQYAVGSKKCSILKSPCDWWPENLSKDDLKIKSPYNTYLYKALPPAPICSPGLSAIKAVLNPKQSEYWFYISGTDGKMHYAKDNEEHQENIQTFLR